MADKLKSESTDAELEVNDPTVPAEEFEELLAVTPHAEFVDDSPAAADKETKRTDVKADAKPETTLQGDSAPKVEQVPAETPTPPVEPELFLGKFKLTGDRDKDLGILAESYKQLESRLGQETSARKRLESIAEHALSLGRTPEKGAPTEPAKPSRTLVDLISKAAVLDESVTDDQILGLVLEAVVNSPKASEKMIEAIQGYSVATTERDKARETYFKVYDAKYEGFSNVPDWLMERVSKGVQDELLAGPDRENYTAESFTKAVLERTADECAKLCHLPLKTNAATAAAPVAKPKVRTQPSGTRSEGGSPRQPQAAEPTGQEAEIAELFG